MLRAVKWAGVVLAGLVGLAALVVAIAATVTKLPGERATPSGEIRNQAVYITMRDGVKIAVDVWLPADYAGGELPTIMYMTRYWRADAVGPLQRAAIGLGLAPTDEQPFLPARIFNEAGYAFVKVDARGSGASFGERPVEFSPEEVVDYGEIAQWVSEQSWSNGKIGSTGVSYNGNTAELLAVPNHPAVLAVAPLYNDFDPQYGLVQPGGAFNRFLERWGAGVAMLDDNDVCGLAGRTGLMCRATKLWTPGVKPVDADKDGAMLKAAMKAHQANANVAEAFSDVEFRDDPISAEGHRVSDVAPYGLRDEIEASGVPMHLWLGWLDAVTADGALARFLTFSNEQHLIIGPYTHGGGLNTDPFADTDAPVDPSPEDQLKEIVRFFDEKLETGNAQKASSSVRYYTMGEGVWRETAVWPPAYVEPHMFYFHENNMLSLSAPQSPAGVDKYTVDFEATTGGQTRWHTNMGGGDVIYEDRAEADKRLLVYETEPLENAFEVTGSPAATLYVASSSDKGVFHAYLEAVAPDGEVVYITEGVFRAIHRKVSTDEPVYAQLGPHHTFLRKDAMPLPVNETAQIDFKLFAISALIPKGYRLRLALAGADASMFRRWPEDETPEWAVARNAANPSYVMVPGRWRRE